jgi:hypothetical protein
MEDSLHESDRLRDSTLPSNERLLKSELSRSLKHSETLSHDTTIGCALRGREADQPDVARLKSKSARYVMGEGDRRIENLLGDRVLYRNSRWRA